jgi:hypothetical protein
VEVPTFDKNGRSPYMAIGRVFTRQRFCDGPFPT